MTSNIESARKRLKRLQDEVFDLEKKGSATVPEMQEIWSTLQDILEEDISNENEIFAHISMKDEHEIGVVSLGVIDATGTHPKDIGVQIRDNGFEDRLVEALKNHFDCPVKVRMSSTIIKLNPIHIETEVLLEEEEEDRYATVTLKETWVY